MPRPPTPAPSALDARAADAPWWRVGMVWLVVGGPFVVVVAALVTAVIAAGGADDVLPPAGAASATGASAPAMQARNHAASPKR